MNKFLCRCFKRIYNSEDHQVELENSNVTEHTRSGNNSNHVIKNKKSPVNGNETKLTQRESSKQNGGTTKDKEEKEEKDNLLAANTTEVVVIVKDENKSQTNGANNKTGHESCSTDVTDL